MIRPLTIATCLLACGSGLYLYQSKHEVQLLDRTIERTVHDTGSLREQSRLLAAEWTMLNDPERLRQFSDTYLSLKTIAPPQFTSLADLDSRLPAPRKEVPPPSVDVQEPGAVVADAGSPGVPDATPADTVVADEDLPVPPIPARPAAVFASTPRPAERVQSPRPVVADNQTRPVTVADARPSEPRPAEQRPFEQRLPEQRVSEQRPPEQRPFEQRQFEQRPAEQRPFEPRAAVRLADMRPEIRPQVAAPSRPIMLAAPRPLPANAPINAPPMQYRPPMVATSAPYGGSLLGMARGSMPPAPRPTPVNAAYNAN
jgi:hypothetical protein